MISSTELNALSEGTLETDVMLSAYTTFQTGGPAAFFVSPKTEEGLSRLLQRLTETETPYFILGRGSNLLVSDQGYKGVVICLRNRFSHVETDGERITAGGGAMLSEVGTAALSSSLGGLEFAWGIPGTVGGAVRMNAGAYGGEIKDVVESVRVMDRKGNVKNLSADALCFGYRKSRISEEGLLVLSACFHLSPRDPQQIRSAMDRIRARRMEKQPLEYASAGSVFKRPEGYYAGTLIEQCGLKGLRVGDACVSEKHAGFIVNLKSASSADIYRLMTKVQEEVYQKTGVRLEREVLLLGEF